MTKNTTTNFGLTKKTVNVIPGISADARALGVTRQHLWMVLQGERRSPSLLMRYKALKAGK